MKAANWQTIALTLFIGVVALWLATACTGGKPGGCATESPELTSRLNTTEEEYQQFHKIDLLTWAVRSKYNSLLWRQPNVYDVTPGFLRDDNGGWTDTWGITVWVTEKVDQNTLSPEDRIPDYLDDLPIRIIQADPPTEGTEPSCDYSKCVANSQTKGGNMENSMDHAVDRIGEVRRKYEPLLWRQPNVHAVVRGLIRDEDGESKEQKGIHVLVVKKVNQDLLPPEDRIPDCLEGVPVQIIETPMPRHL